MSGRFTWLISVLVLCGSMLGCGSGDGGRSGGQATAAPSNPELREDVAPAPPDDPNPDPVPEAGEVPDPIEVQGYYVIRVGAPTLTQPAHVIVTGRGGHVGSLFARAAAAKAKRWSEIEPEHPIELLIHNELGREKMEPLLATWGFENPEYVDANLDAEQIVAQTARYAKLRSLEIFSHGRRASLTLALPESGFHTESRATAALRRKFDASSFAALWGCNTGYELAPYLSRLWRIPVSGALTSSAFEHLHSTGEFYPFNEFSRPPGPWSLQNPFSYATTRKCAEGACLRMRPDDFAYNGAWGRYPEGLEHYKFFCVGIPQADCARRMALSIESWISTKPASRAQPASAWKDAIGDFLCPISNARPVKTECLQKLREIEFGQSMDYTAFRGKQITCDFERCYEGTTPAHLGASSTLAREYQMYLRGLDQLGLQ